MSDIATGPAAADKMASWHTYGPRLCLNAVSRAFQGGDATHASTVSPLVSVSTAAQHWARMPAQYKHEGDRDFANIPKGAVVQLTGGDGHIFISEGGGMGVSTDYPVKGAVSVAPIADIVAHFSGNPYGGWGAWINGRAIEGLVQVAPPAPTPAPSGGVTMPTKAQWLVIQAGLKRRGRYAGVVDGVPGPLTWKGVQLTARSGGGYAGPIDGLPGRNTWIAVQTYAKRWGGYTGPIDGLPGFNTWAGFAAGVK